MTKIPPIPDSWLAGLETPEEIAAREHEWKYFQCQKKKDHFRALLYECQKQSAVNTFYKNLNK